MLKSLPWCSGRIGFLGFLDPPTHRNPSTENQRKRLRQCWNNLKMAKHSIDNAENIQFWKDLINRERCEMLTCNCFATFEIVIALRRSTRRTRWANYQHGPSWTDLKWNRLPASNQESAERAQDAIIQTCYVVSPHHGIVASWHCGKSSVPKIESARPEGHWVPGRRHHSVNLNAPGTESIICSPVRPLHGLAQSELQVGTWPWLADSQANLNLPGRPVAGGAAGHWVHDRIQRPLRRRLSDWLTRWPTQGLLQPTLFKLILFNEWLHWYATNIYVHIHTHIYIYMHIGTYTGRYIHCMKSTIFYWTHAVPMLHTCIYNKHIQYKAWLVSGWSPTMV